MQPALNLQPHYNIAPSEPIDAVFWQPGDARRMPVECRRGLLWVCGGRDKPVKKDWARCAVA
jgi:hypothetical protein